MEETESECDHCDIVPGDQMKTDPHFPDIESIETNNSSDILESTKEERRRLHEEKFEKAAKKRELNRRKLLAEELMRIFAANDELFHATLKELKVSKTGTSNLSEYHQFYMDSLPSFGALLYEDLEENEHSLRQFGLSSARILDLNEKFARGGFSDPENSKKYRVMVAMLKRDAELQSSIQKYQAKYDKQSQELKIQEKLLKIMESRYDAVDLDDAVSANDLIPFLHRDHSDSLDETRDGESHPITNENNNLAGIDINEDEVYEELMRDLLDGALSQLAAEKDEEESSQVFLRKQKNKVLTMEKEIANTQRRLAKVRELRESLEFPLSEDEFQSATLLIMNLSQSLTPALASFIESRHADFEKYRLLEQHTDLTKPHEWYPYARLNKRKIIFHAGPTNSGKTYHALQRLKQAKKGMYLAPLRLLAAEVYENLTSEGIYTNLITGQEAREVPFSTHVACTVELADINRDYEVVVIDEIQMLCDSFRGFAWTRALMGVRCKEIHVCGGAEAREIVEKICKMCGDDIEIKNYERFSELKVQTESLAMSSTEKGSYAKVRPGDCVVAFSKPDIFAIKREIENSTQYKCCVIYGTLPPEIRAEQARRFNDPNSGYDVLVASDAIGMGLNLSIKRIIFNSMFKNNGEKIVQLDHSSVKQIAGRAGRRNSPYPHGEVTCRDPFDMKHLRKCMSTEIEPIMKAGLIPTASHIGLFNDLLMKYGPSHDENELHKTIRQFSEMATLQGDFFLCRKKSMEDVARWLIEVPLPAPEKFMLALSPISEGCQRSKNVLMRYVQKHVNGEVPGLHRTMRPKAATSFDHLTNLCK